MAKFIWRSSHVPIFSQMFAHIKKFWDSDLSRCSDFSNVPPIYECLNMSFLYFCSTFHNWSDPSAMSSTAPVEFDEGYNKQVIPLPVQLPRLFDYNSIHESRVTVEKLTELYQCMYSFIDGGDQNLVPTKVRAPNSPQLQFLQRRVRDCSDITSDVQVFVPNRQKISWSLSISGRGSRRSGSTRGTRSHRVKTTNIKFARHTYSVLIVK